jgi:hypothetical protein
LKLKYLEPGFEVKALNSHGQILMVEDELESRTMVHSKPLTWKYLLRNSAVQNQRESVLRHNCFIGEQDAQDIQFWQSGRVVLGWKLGTPRRLERRTPTDIQTPPTPAIPPAIPFDWRKEELQSEPYKQLIMRAECRGKTYRVKTCRVKERSAGMRFPQGAPYKIFGLFFAHLKTKNGHF